MFLTLSLAAEQYCAAGAILCLSKQLTLCSQQHIDQLFPGHIPYSTTNKLPPSAPNNKKWLVFKCPHLRNCEHFCVSVFIIMYGYHFCF